MDQMLSTFQKQLVLIVKKRPTALLVILTEKSNGAFRFKICALNECKPFIYLLDIN